ncbi:hypothetical protein UAJ10_04225 [Nitrospirillum sp. BR 11164]|uniref:hypothetical protein n=1 Tax=Nitrospirillum sp. BR 11164 TaxID=3104324 RepID=UPI002AFDF08B|nr:hypothetical protein [Nitrospirillum sp. BR 11164]MEA1648221.1 hypothetical protein [Nitrospirillum sp. BR 11164]
MTDHTLIVARDGTLTLHTAPAIPTDGEVLTLTDCPADWTAEDVLALARDCRLPARTASLAFGRLLARHRGSCCGGHCG